VTHSYLLANDYAQEIRSWLVARIGKQIGTGEIRPVTEAHLPPRALLWWIFEGKLYPWLEGSLCESWQIIDNHARCLLGTYSPIWREVDIPEGETDWLASAFRSVTSNRSVYVCRASRPGLDDKERIALMGWLEWVRVNWAEYVTHVTPPAGVSAELPWGEDDLGISMPDPRLIRRWAHTAKRSRWPLLRTVVAESFRCTFEPQELLKLPLPDDHATLFELVCMVRILGALEPTPDHIRWLDLENSRNRLEVAELSYAFQHHIPAETVLATSEFDYGLRNAMLRQNVRVPQRADGWLEFKEPRNGFKGILIEAKSGSQSFDATLLQLKCYRAALKRLVPGRFIVWGIVEQVDPNSENAAINVPTLSTPDTDTDQWVFSSADQIGPVLQRFGLTSECRVDVLREVATLSCD